MSSEDNLNSAISNSRRVSQDGSLVTYNLTKGVDFSNPRKVADALAVVFFEKDAVNWFKAEGDHIEFDPKYKVRILLAEEHNKLLERTVDDFLEDLKKKELNKKFIEQISDLTANMVKLQTAMTAHAISAFFGKGFNRKIDKIEVEDDLFTDILEVLEIRTPSNADLMDWENLPI